jgi:hypothetical protein
MSDIHGASAMSGSTGIQPYSTDEIEASIEIIYAGMHVPARALEYWEAQVRMHSKIQVLLRRYLRTEHCPDIRIPQTVNRMIENNHGLMRILGLPQDPRRIQMNNDLNVRNNVTPAAAENCAQIINQMIILFAQAIKSGMDLRDWPKGMPIFEEKGQILTLPQTEVLRQAPTSAETSADKQDDHPA